VLPTEQSRPGDVFIPIWSLNTPCCLDVTVVVPKPSNPLPPALNDSSYRPWYNADEAEKAKILKHGDKCSSMGILFHPLVFEAGGFIHERARTLLEEIADQRA